LTVDCWNTCCRIECWLLKHVLPYWMLTVETRVASSRTSDRAILYRPSHQESKGGRNRLGIC